MNNSNQTQRIICDCYAKKNKEIFGTKESKEFDRRIVAVNKMYGWLYDRGILKNVSFAWKNYFDATVFAFDAQDLLPHRGEMERSGIEDAELAAKMIFDEPISKCLYSGAIELSWTMETYRDRNGVVSHSWECELIRMMDNSTILEVRQIKEKKGTKKAVKKMFELFGFAPSEL